jgi:carboxypeptidase Taq
MSAYAEFIQTTEDIYRLSAIAGHLGWDQEVLMPQKGGQARGEMMSWLAKEKHQKLTSETYGNLISTLEQDSTLSEDEKSNVREMRISYDKAKALPVEFVSRYAQLRSNSLRAWQEARAKSDFSLFLPHLKELVEMTKEKIAFYPPTDTPYDALLDEFEFGMKVSDYDPLFSGLKGRIVPLLQAIIEAKKHRDSIQLPSGMVFSIESQTRFCTEVSKRMGFDFDAGRMDQSTHPFSSGLWKGDTRFTTRFDESDPFSCLYAVMHETGHALYEQGLPHEYAYCPRGQAVSLGVHESQSRFWENQIGRTDSFWKVVLPVLKKEFPELPDWDAETLNLLANDVEPGYIRVEADEVTYNLHIMIRYEIEKLIFNENLPLEDIPQVWNSMMKDWFDLDVEDDANGCLQDIHWSMGAFGYFPTYTLGNLYASQLLDAMSKEIGNVTTMIESGNWLPILEWLKDKIHNHGSLFTPAELIEHATGQPPTAEPFIKYLEKKYAALYRLDL